MEALRDRHDLAAVTQRHTAYHLHSWILKGYILLENHEKIKTVRKPDNFVSVLWDKPPFWSPFSQSAWPGQNPKALQGVAFVRPAHARFPSCTHKRQLLASFMFLSVCIPADEKAASVHTLEQFSQHYAPPEYKLALFFLLNYSEVFLEDHFKAHLCTEFIYQLVNEGRSVTNSICSMRTNVRCYKPYASYNE